MPSVAKSIAEEIFGSRLAFAVADMLRPPRELVLAFHNILPEGVPPRGDRSLHLSVTGFRDILDWLPNAFDVVPLDDVFAGPGEEGARPRAAITFDDAYEGAIAVGIPELQRRGLPATVFVVSGAESGQTFWWDSLADRFPGGLPAELRETALTGAHGREDEVRSWARMNAYPMAQMSGPFVAASWDEIERSAALPGVTIGSHTRTHANLASLDRADVANELIESQRELATRMPGVRRWLAYPYGRLSPVAERAAEEAGYEMALRVNGGTTLRSDNASPRFRLPRLNVPAGLTLAGFRLRAAGLLGR